MRSLRGTRHGYEQQDEISALKKQVVTQAMAAAQQQKEISALTATMQKVSAEVVSQKPGARVVAGQ